MEINLNSAIKTLKDIDKQLKAQVQVPKKGASGKKGGPSGMLKDSVELSNGAKQVNGLIKSPSASELYGELSSQLSSLTDMIGGDSQRQQELSGMFQDPDQAVKDRAQELLDGYFNVENTSERIFGFAFSFFEEGSDREAFAREMQGHIHEGFRQAEKMMGGLADISVKTRDRIDEMVDAFIDDGQSGEQKEAEGVEA